MNKYKILRMRDSSEKHYTKKKRIFDIPFRLLVVGKSHLSGKTNLLGNLLLRPEYYYGDFKGENIYIISPSSSDPKLQTIRDKLEIPQSNFIPQYDEMLLDGIINIIKDEYNEAIEDKKTPNNTLIVFDDMSFGGALLKRHSNIQRIFCNMRHYNCSCIITTQSYIDLLTACRENASGCYLFACSDRQLDSITDDHSYIPKKQFRKMFRDITRDKHSYLAINYSNDANERYLDSDLKPINVEQYA
tara:strand:- start:54 stop:788 length:735 start_codon:yes stop_codon:yes gene_type:complete